MHFEILIIKLKTLIEMKINISYSLAWLDKCVEANPQFITEILSYELQFMKFVMKQKIRRIIRKITKRKKYRTLQNMLNTNL